MEALGPHLPGPGAPSRTVAAGNGAVPPVDVRGTRRVFLIVEDVVEVGELSSQYLGSKFYLPSSFLEDDTIGQTYFHFRISNCDKFLIPL